MYDSPSHLRADLISDYVAERLDAEDAALVETAIRHDPSVAAAVMAARRVKLRMARRLSAKAPYARLG
jgi:anti-sigma-K factor RskA